jgi:hypothetical protein
MGLEPDFEGNEVLNFENVLDSNGVSVPLEDSVVKLIYTVDTMW